MAKIRTKKQIYNDCIIKEYGKNVNYHLYFDKAKLQGNEFLKLLNYLKPLKVVIDDKNNTIDFYKYSQINQLKLVKNW